MLGNFPVAENASELPMINNISFVVERAGFAIDDLLDCVILFACADGESNFGSHPCETKHTKV
jgi:hypothetical protein